MLFKKKEADEALMKEFWKWFEEREKWIIETSKVDGMAVVEAVDKFLTPIFQYFKKSIEFQLGFNNGQGEFFFFDLKNKYLNRDAHKLSNLMPDKLKERWVFIIEH